MNNENTLNNINTTNNIKSNGGKGHIPFFVATGVFIVLYALVTWLVVTGRTQAFDNSVIDFILSIRTPALNTVIEAITYLGNTETIVIICLLLLLFTPSWIPMGIPVSLVAIFSTAVRILSKTIVGRPRPDESLRLIHETSTSFPSGHATASIAVYGLLFFMTIYYWKKGIKYTKRPVSKVRMGFQLGITGFLAIFIGLTRIYICVHYASDVIGGWMLGLIFASFAAGMIVYIVNRKERFSKIYNKLKRGDRKEEAARAALKAEKEQKKAGKEGAEGAEKLPPRLGDKD